MLKNEINTFIAVSDCGSFGKAAERCFISPTAVMKQMNYLEEETGLKLLNRTHRGITLTESGKAYYKEAKFLIAHYEASLAEIRENTRKKKQLLRVGTSLLNPCKPFMDIWNELSDEFSGFRIQIVPFDDNHTGILDIIGNIGKKFDFIVGVCDSKEWLRRCSILVLGSYRKCVTMAADHPLAKKEHLSVNDLHGETLMMVKVGDSPLNDEIRKYLTENHPEVTIEDTDHYYDMDVFNRCEETKNLLLNIECWKDIHPSLVTKYIDWDFKIQYGILYSKNPPPAIKKFIERTENYIKQKKL